MANDLTHASFFSGVGGLDLGLERAGWRTVSFSEIDPYASAVLAERWPGVPNLGSIVEVERSSGRPLCDGGRHSPNSRCPEEHRSDGAYDSDYRTATLWSGGFPCQDLSVAGKRRGMGEGTRSGLAYSFLALAERHRPRFVLLENVPGLLSSHGGRDMAALLGALVELGYGVGYRILDARYFGVPQRRRRVFILGDSLGGRAGAERAAEVLSVGSRCRRHPSTGIEAGPGVAASPRAGFDIARAVTGTSGKRHDDDTDTLIPLAPHDARGQGRRGEGSAAVGGYESDDGHQPDADALRRAVRPSPDPRGVRAPDGLAGRMDDRPVAYVKTHNVSATDGEHWTDADREARSMSAFDGARTTLVTGGVSDDPLLPQGLDSHRYRCCGNGVVSDVAEWIGYRLAALA